MSVIEIILCIFIIIPIYTYILYPFLVHILAKIINKPIKISKEIGEPDISVLLSVYNEEDYVVDAVDSLYNCDYPKEKIHLYIGSDGSTDRTDELIEELKTKYPNINSYRYNRAGKNNVLNQLMKHTRTELIFIMDADLRLTKGCLNILIPKFSDESIGLVQASLKIIEEQQNDNAGREGETLYQKYETWIRINESKVGTAANALGTLYGIRRSNLTFIPSNKVMDDLFNVCYTIYSKKRILFDTECFVYEVRKKSLTDEFLRRIRMVGGGLGAIWSLKRILLPSYGWGSFFIWSHKILRYFSPINLIIIALITIILPTDSIFWIPLVIIQLCLYLFALIGWIFEKFQIKFILFRLSLFIISMNVGFLLGLIRFINQKPNSIWDHNTIQGNLK